MALPPTIAESPTQRSLGLVLVGVGLIAAITAVLAYVTKSDEEKIGYDALPNLMWVIIGMGVFVGGLVLYVTAGLGRQPAAGVPVARGTPEGDTGLADA